MAKGPTITTIASGYYSRTALNDNFTNIDTAFDNTLSLDGSAPNALGADLDLNNNDILNANNIYAADIIVAGSSVSASVSASAASAAAALVSEANASTSATAASLSATQAAQYDGIWLDDVAALLADTTLTYTAGQPSTVVVGDYVRTRKEGFAYQVATVGNVTTAGGIQLDVLAGDGIFIDASFGADGSSFVALQSALTASAGAELRLTVQHSIGVNTLDITGNGTKLSATLGAGITYSTPTNKGIVVTGNDCIVTGLTINAPATFNGVNTRPLYSVIWVDGSRCEVSCNILNNVPKSGVLFNDSNLGSVYGNFIYGNYPTASYTGTETGHFGVYIDPSSTTPSGLVRVFDNHIEGCVQGVLQGNFGTASQGYGLVVANNTFFECWNHGVYVSSTSAGASITGNAFSKCQIPVAATGSYHTVVGNTLQTGGSSGTITDWTGISMRDSIGCVVSGNTIQGEHGTAQSVISFTQTYGTSITGNVVSGNTVNITGSATAHSIRFGGSTTVNMQDNIISGNSLKGAAAANQGNIYLLGASSGCDASGTIVSQNTVVIRGGSNGIHLVYTSGVKIVGNAIRIEYDAPSPITIGAIVPNACTNIDIENNSVTVLSAWGTNVSLRVVWELTSTSGGVYLNNTVRADLTKLVSMLHYVNISGGGTRIHDTGTGVPAINAGVGSSWHRSDGGTSTSFYVKESAANSSGWVAK